MLSTELTGTGAEYSADDGGAESDVRYNGIEFLDGAMPMTLPAQKTTVEQFEAFIARPENAERRFELIHGEVVEKMPTEEHALIIILIGAALLSYFRQNPIGRVGTDARFRPGHDDENDRRPDVHATLDPQPPVVTKGPRFGVPDIAVEVKSPDDLTREMREKALYYLENGAKLVWLVFPDKKIVETYSADADDVWVQGDILTAPDLLPGFSLPLRDIFIYS